MCYPNRLEYEAEAAIIFFLFLLADHGQKLIMKQPFPLNSQ